jgi:GNAT superfamily N-acetyltransferase
MFQLQLLAVHPDFQRQGIGAALCKHGLDMVSASLAVTFCRAQNHGQADAAGAASCLETNSDDNVRRLLPLLNGFHVYGDFIRSSFIPRWGSR